MLINKENKKEIRNILIIGKTGNGKSTLANTLLNKDNIFSEVFKENSSSISVTKKSQESYFEWNKINYRIIDTIGLGDTKLSNKEVFYNIAETIGMMKEGISHLLFIISSRFTEEEKNNFKIVKNILLESGIIPYTTIIRTNFEKFEMELECKKDHLKLLKESEDVKNIINSCNGFIHINNPSMDAFSSSPVAFQLAIKEEFNRIKNIGRIKLLSHLENNYNGSYKLKSWDKIHLRINNYLNNKNSVELNSFNHYEIEEERALVIRDTITFIQEEVPSVNRITAKNSPSLWWCLLL